MNIIILIIILLIIIINVCNGFIISNNIRTKLKSHRHRSTSTIQMSIQGPVRYASNDWVLCLSSLPTSRILKQVKFFIIFTTFWSTFLVILKQKFSLMLPISTIPHSLASTALGLLLVFRTNASYDRYLIYSILIDLIIITISLI